METIYIIVGLFSLAALLGMILLSYVLKSKETPKGLALIHGPVAAAGLIALIIYTINNHRMFIASIVLFSLAVIGGLVLIVKDLSERNKPLPKGLAIGHGLIALAGFVILIVNAFVK